MMSEELRKTPHIIDYMNLVSKPKTGPGFFSVQELDELIRLTKQMITALRTPAAGQDSAMEAGYDY